MEKNNAEIPDFSNLEKIVSLLDSKYTFPGTRFRFGLDPILGLVPWIGDVATFLIQGTLVVYMMRHGASGKVALKMFLNVFFDTVLGAIPIIGQIADFFFKANTKNIRLLKEHYFEGKHKGSGWGIVAVMLLLLFGVLVLMVYVFYKLISWIISLIG